MTAAARRAEHGASTAQPDGSLTPQVPRGYQRSARARRSTGLALHAGLSSFQGGFLGVNVFFVISGFLIPGKIHRDARDGNFSFLHFYDSRGQELCPRCWS